MRHPIYRDNDTEKIRDTIKAKHFFLWLLTTLWVTPLFAAQTPIKILDQNGDPVANAVISYADATPPAQALPNAIMDQVDKQFLPNVLIIQRDQSVTFPNSDNIRHHIYSFSKPKPFEIRMFKGGEFKSVTFNEPGIVVLGCNIHDQMIGYIYVADHKQTALSDSDGIAVIDSSAQELTIWHSQLSANNITRVTIPLSDVVKNNNSVNLKLLPKKVAKPQRKFGSSNFGSKGN